MANLKEIAEKTGLPIERIADAFANPETLHDHFIRSLEKARTLPEELAIIIRHLTAGKRKRLSAYDALLMRQFFRLFEVGRTPQHSWQLFLFLPQHLQYRIFSGLHASHHAFRNLDLILKSKKGKNQPK